MDTEVFDLSQPLWWTVDDVLTKPECDAMIARIESSEREVAPISTAAGPVLMPEARNNTRVMFDDHEIAALLFARIRTRVPAVLSGSEVVGANERIRCYRYGAGQRFALHTDGRFVRSPVERSLLSYLVYLNEDFRGGATAFPETGETITPKSGRALLFQHFVLHEGCVVERGVKYVVRTDVMYRAR